MSKNRVSTVAVIGLGLIGGSFCLDLRRLNLVDTLIGYDICEEHCEEALSLGIVDYAAPEYDDHLSSATLVILATPVKTYGKILPNLASKLKDGTILSDVGSVKQSFMKYAQMPEYQHLRFVGGHPIAGSEQFGPQSARTHLFEDKRFILTPNEDTNADALEQVRYLWEQIGSKVHDMSPFTHDHVFAAVSHLPHLLAYASIHTIEETETPQALAYSGAGLKDFSRIASSSPEMWVDIFLENQESLLTHLTHYQNLLKQIEELILSENKEELLVLLQQSKALRDHWMTGLENEPTSL